MKWTWKVAGSDTATLTFTGTMFATNGSLTNSGIQSIEAMKTGNWQGMLAVYGNNTFTYMVGLEKKTKPNKVLSKNYSIHLMLSMKLA